MKKKFAAAVLSLALAAGLCGCDRATTEIEPPDFNQPFTCTVKMTCGELETSAQISRLGENMWETLFSEPPTLAGVKLCFYDDTVSASYKGLAFSVPKAAMPVESMLGGFIEAVENLARSTEAIKAREKDGALEIEGSTDAGNYTMTLNSKGTELMKFEMPSLPLLIEFECFTPGTGQQTTTPPEGTNMPGTATTTAPPENTTTPAQTQATTPAA